MNDFSPDKMIRQRAHAERMLARAERRHHQASRLLEKWKLRIAQSGQKARLWSYELPEAIAEGSDTLAP
jgi:hypothetical protein